MDEDELTDLWKDDAETVQWGPNSKMNGDDYDDNDDVRNNSFMCSMAQMWTCLPLHLWFVVYHKDREFIFLIYKYRRLESYIHQINLKGLQNFCFGRDKLSAKHKFEYKCPLRCG